MSIGFSVLSLAYVYYDAFYLGSAQDVEPIQTVDYLPAVVSTLWAQTASPVPSVGFVDGSVTPSPTGMVSPTPGSYLILPATSTPVLPSGAVRKDFLLSFYDPDIGRLFPEIALINCHTWNFDTKVCESPMGNGEDHRENYWKALACPKYYEYGTVFVVSSPSWLAGEWICKDHGDLILPQGEYLDFLIPVNDILARFDGNINNFPWSSLVETIIYLEGVQ